MSNEKLVENLKYNNYLKTKSVIDAFLSVPREHFVPEKYKKHAYTDSPLPIGRGQTISAPSMVAVMLELLELRRGQKVLEIGCGSGWNAALMATIIKPGIVYSTEIETELAELAEKNIKKVGVKNIRIIVTDGSLGYEKQKPYDVIILTCAASKVPEALLKQLKIGGMLMAPVGWLQQTLTIIKRTKKGLERTTHGGCVFVPLRTHT